MKRNVTVPVASGDQRSRGRLRSYTRVIDNAQLVQVVVKNTESKGIKSIDWDFAFPRYEAGQLLLRFDVASKVEIKPGGKKTLKYHLPPGAKKCEVVKVVSDENQPEKVSTFEAVCGAGFRGKGVELWIANVDEKDSQTDSLIRSRSKAE